MTQKEMVKKYISDFGSITSWQAFSDLGITRLSAIIYSLKQECYRFKTSRVTKTNRYGKKVAFAKYEYLKV